MCVHVEPLKELISLPEDWEALSLLRQKQWFLRNYGVYAREGELSGIRADAPTEVKEAFETFLRQPDCPWHSVL